MRDAAIDDLDVHLFREAICLQLSVPRYWLLTSRLETQMAALHMIDLEPTRPDYLGMLVLGRDPFRHLPMAWVSFCAWQEMIWRRQVITSHDMKDFPRQMDQIIELSDRVMTAVTSRLVTKNAANRTIRFPPSADHSYAVRHRIYEGRTAPVRIYGTATASR